ncbi:dynamin-related GTPase DNM1 [Sugiyamaella lignohabitans]|uniref:dynamin GTPase n=1 Tax=Sugiyamaella lignohabitans TaxID=796027 RepID=A0A167EUC0_9ASCO|nr:dynamin-related GTPase DNM1 [Sugiyamaella lignohabitans]ANB14464.1 dynamin-related GTPase DNM1 [Sugiyamaella lignohabitans]
MAALEDLIPVVNKLQDLVFNTIGSDTLDLPQVVVVGSQSSGKSSVLENIVGRDFLPRGTGIVTRRPLILQLVNIPSSAPPTWTQNDNTGYGTNNVNNGSTSSNSTTSNSLSSSPASTHGAIAGGGPNPNATFVREAEWGEFLHIPGRRFYDFSDIRREIESETARIAGNNKGINRLPINLKIFSPHVLNLTLVDLPGLTKIPIGDQPTDIERQTRGLISEYIAKPNSIILAVSPANVDLVNSESLKLARQVDPQGKRTIGVLTKLDLMDQGTNALDILSGHVYPLKLGFIGVVNRSQQDIQEGKSLDESLTAEKNFFATHPVYRNIAHKCGTAYLAKSLNQTLMAHIRDRLPDIKARLNTLMGQTEQELASYGVDSSYSKENRGPLILQLMTRFASSFIASIEGTSSEISTKELCGGARIYYIYNEVFGQSLTNIDPVGTLSHSDVRTAIRNSTGPRPSLFVPELAFDLLVKPQIKLLEGPSQRCVELVYEELMKICHNCGSTELSRYPKLQAKLIEVISDLLRERLGPTSAYVSSLIDIQRAYINTNHPNFVGAAAAMASVLEEKQAKEKKVKELEKAAHEKKLLGDLAFNGSAATDGSDTPVSGQEPPADHILQNGSADQTKKKHRPSSSSNPITNNVPATHEATPNGHKDSFLNYFFGKDGAEQSSVGGHSALSARSKDSPFIQSPAASDPSSARFDLRDIESSLDNPLEHFSEREQLECELITRLIISYFDIVRESIQDQVPKAVMHLLVNFSKESAQNRLVSELYKESLFDDLLYEDETLAQEREKCQNMLKTYKEAARVIGEVV